MDSVLPPSAATTDRRSEPRTRYSSRAQLLHYPPARHAHPVDVDVVDYSENGIGVIYGEGLLTGQTFIVREPQVTKDRTCLYQVVRCEKRPDGTYSIGLSAMELLEGDEYAPFMPPPAPGLDIWTKLLYLTFAIAGAITIVLAAITIHGVRR